MSLPIGGGCHSVSDVSASQVLCLSLSLSLSVCLSVCLCQWFLCQSVVDASPSAVLQLVRGVLSLSCQRVVDAIAGSV